MLLFNHTFILSSLSANVSDQKSINLNDDEAVEFGDLPIWPRGTEWRYKASFSFKINDDNTDLSLSLSMNNLHCEVIQNSSRYLLKITSPISGSISIDMPDFPRLSATLKNTELNGFLTIEKDTISIKEFNADISGRLSINLVPINLNMNAIITFDPGYTPIQFPLQIGNQWPIDSTSFMVVGKISLPGITQLFSAIPDEIPLNYTFSTMYKSAVCTKQENVSIDPGSFPSFLIAVDDDLHYFYSKVAGNIVKVFIEDDGSDFFDYEFEAALQSTNYVMPGSPAIPDPPTGTVEGCPDKAYNYTAVTTDPENDHIFYSFDWGDGHVSSWIGPVDSGKPVSIEKTWEKQGTYYVYVNARDIHGNICPWSDPLRVRMPKNTDELYLHPLLKLISARFPRVFSLF